MSHHNVIKMNNFAVTIINLPPIPISPLEYLVDVKQDSLLICIQFLLISLGQRVKTLEYANLPVYLSSVVPDKLPAILD